MLAGDEDLDLLQHWALDPGVTHLNHGSFGACPRVVIQAQRDLQDRLESNPMQFFVRELEAMLDEARAELARFVQADADDLAFVPNASTGVNTVLRSIEWARDDELLVTDHAYNACRNALDFIAARSGARVLVAKIPFPIDSPERVMAAIVEAATPRTKLALIDHVTSPTALVFPIEAIVRCLEERGIDTLVDGAHAPGMLPLALSNLGAAYYTGNCHKWLCAPKGSAFLHVRRDKQEAIRPLVISHGANTHRPSRSRFRVELDWTGTCDPTPFLCVPHAIRFLAKVWPDGHTALMARNRALAVRAQLALSVVSGHPAPSPPEMVGSIASVILPPGAARPLSAFDPEPLQASLAARARIETPVFSWGTSDPLRLIRVSAHAYTRWSDVQRLVEVLPTHLRDTA